MPITLDPPATGDFSITLGTPNATNGTDSLLLNPAASGGFKGYLRTLPGGDFTVTVKMTGSMGANFNGMWIAFRDTAGKYVMYGMVHNTTGVVAVDQWTNITTFSGGFHTMGVGDSEWPTWFRVQFTSSTSDLQCQYSYTGDTWINSGGSCTFLGTADAVGIVTRCEHATVAPTVWFEHFALA